MLSVIACAGLPAGARAQELQPTLRVEVRSKAGPVIGAQVTANGLVQGTDRSGVALIPVALGSVALSVKKAGFLPAAVSLTVDEGRLWPVTVDLEPDEAAEQEITVYATRTNTRLQDSPTRVEVMNGEEIEEKIMMTPGDIVMLLNEMGGMRVQTTSPGLGAAAVRIQGMRGRYTRFLSDGLPLFGQQGGGLGLLQIPPTDLAQVEVIKGVSSALYGAGAMGGVVNLTSRRPGDEPAMDFIVNRSTLGATDFSSFLARKLARGWGGSFLGGGHFQQANDRDGDGWADLAGYTRGIARPRAYWDGGQGRAGFVTAGYTYENRDGGTLPGRVLAATGTPYQESLRTRRYDVGGSFQFLVARKYVVTSRFATSRQDHHHQFGEVRERDRHEMLFGEVSARGTNGRNTWVAGVAADRDAYRPWNVPRFGYTFVTPGIFAQDDLDLASWLSVSVSARADFHSQYGTFFSPRVSSLIRWAGWTSRISAGQGFFAPTPLTEETEAAGLTRLAIPAPLAAERGRSVSIDLTRTVGPGTYSVVAFASRIADPIFVSRQNRYALFNLAQPNSNRGLEFLGTWRKAPFAVTASYTFVQSRETEPSGVRTDVPLTPRHSLGVVGMWEKEDVGRIGLEAYYTGRQRLEENPYRRQSQPYYTFGLLGEKRFGPFRLFLNIENLTDVRQTRWDSMLRPTRALDGRWTVDAWAPLDGRVINGGLRLKF
jgi:iron complex outermembrane receptor protein